MRCIIAYKNGPFYGRVDIGVQNEADPAADREVAKMKDRGYEILSVKFW